MRGLTGMFFKIKHLPSPIQSSASTGPILRTAIFFLAGATTIGCTSLAGPQEISNGTLNSIRLTDSDEKVTLSPNNNPAVTEPRSAASRSPSTDSKIIEEQPSETASPLTLTEKSQQLFNRLAGQQQEDTERAQQLYQRADQAFKAAAKQPRSQAAETFTQAAELFEVAGNTAPGTALQQDAMFMQGESLFFADRFVAASDVYERLQKEFPRNRHIDKVAARLFSISRYWIDISKAEQSSWSPINLTDSKYPRLDAKGHAIRVLDQIRFDDPTGRLADDATLAAAVEYMRQEKYQEADEFLTDLRETFSDSEHLFIAHLLGVNVKLQTYRGPKYSGLALEEAEKLVRQTRERFPDKLASTEEDFGQRLERLDAQISFLQAERLRYRAEYREKRKEFGAASYYYNLLLAKYPNTPHAENARERLAATDEKPRKPAQRLSWLTTIFPDSTAKDAPLELERPVEIDSSKVILR